MERALARAGSPVIVVVDGYQHVAATGVDRALFDIVRHLPNVRLVISLRSPRRLPEHLYLDLDPVVLDSDDLAFSQDETQQLAALTGVELDEGETEGLHRATSGWPEVTRAVLHRLQAIASDGPRDHPGVEAIVTQYFQSRVLSHGQPAGQTRLAMATSVPEEFTAELAELLADETADTVRDVLETFSNDNVLLAESKDGQTVYRWPPGARQALRREMERRDEVALGRHHSVIGGWHRDRGDMAAALHHATEARDWPLVIDVIDRGWRNLVRADNQLLHRAFVSMPIEELERSPRAMALRDTRLNVPDDRLLAVANLPASAASLEALGRANDVADILDTSLAVVLALRLRGALDTTTTYGRRALTVARTARTSYPEEVLLLNPVLHLHVGIAELLSGDLARAADTLGYAYDRGQFVDPGHHVRQDSAAKLSLTYAVGGDLRQADVWIERHAKVEPPDETWLAPVILSGVTAARLLVATERLHIAEAGRLDTQLQAHVERDELRSYLVFARGQLAVANGRASDALALAAAVRAANERWLGNRIIARPLLTALEVDALLALGQGNLAKNLLAGPDGGHPLTCVAHARLALLTGRADTALQTATDTSWEPNAWARHRLEMRLIRAVAAHRCGRDDLAEASLAQAVTLARPGDSLRAFATVPRADLEELAARVPSAAELLEDPRLAEVGELFPAAVPLVELSERELEVLQDLAAGLTVPEIAQKSVLSYNTVRTQQRSLYRKLGTSHRTEAVAQARRLGLLQG